MTNNNISLPSAVTTMVMQPMNANAQGSVHDVENYSEPETAISSFFTMVHLKDGKPASVDKIEPITDEDKELYNLGKQTYLGIKSKYK
ncbi:MAG: hypothetical protein PHY91_08560 [Tissierellia bacterium]|nr:hypothetical protein [Tissierellia bacterium]